MECLFPASMARTLTELESLEVIDCGVEVIVEKEEVEGRLVFPKLTSSALGVLQKLKWISPGAHNLKWPELKELKVWGCDQVSIFASKFSRFQETSQQYLLESSIQHPFFLAEEGTFPKLEALKLDLHDLTTQCDQFLIESFCNLKFLEVQCNHDTSAIFPSNLLKRLQNLEKLVVSYNSWQEIFQYEEFIGPRKHARLLPRLKELIVSKAQMLTHLWKEDIQESLAFHKVLEILVVSECHKLKSLVPSLICFPNLTDLEILGCNGLINLITCPTAKSLVQLRKMSVSSCKGITEIVAKGDDQAKVNMGVESCANLNSIFLFKMFKVFQSLELVNVVRCGSLKQVFDLQGPSFQETSVVTVTQLKHLYLDHLPKLMHISNKDPRDIWSFQNLCDVRVVGCESMECLFPTFMVKTLTELESLVVIGYGIEVIVEKEEAEGRLVFPKLTSVALRALQKLKWISPGHII
ncbi:uncharacterized protein LOC122274500 [Carya illinoinensis]|uniref:uncharacterized protein LOC122274500 n=1 Tax=Carya illinoinensis TaxID=32201 RepID=UPI001C7237C2|nr:uncharacterized protein LOC122274500 [Carya illinoinensis]